MVDGLGWYVHGDMAGSSTRTGCLGVVQLLELDGVPPRAPLAEAVVMGAVPTWVQPLKECRASAEALLADGSPSCGHAAGSPQCSCWDAAEGLAEHVREHAAHARDGGDRVEAAELYEMAFRLSGSTDDQAQLDACRR